MFAKSKLLARPFNLALIAALSLAAAGTTLEANAANATASATASVITPIAVTSVGTLAFGKFVPGASAGSVTVSTSGARTATVVTPSGGTPGAASFPITGEPSTTYAIDTSATTANLTSGANTMALALVTDFSGGGAISGTQATGTLDNTGKQTLYVGGILTVGANQANGAYTGTVSVAVAYN
jgi:spore coat protein U-like protein